MKFLCDMPVSGKVVAYLNLLGYNTIHCREIKMEQASDEEIFQVALQEKRIIITMDLDFSAIFVFQKVKFPSLIIFRIKEPKPEKVIQLFKDNFKKIKQPLEKGSIIIIEDFRIRIRELPI